MTSLHILDNNTDKNIQKEIDTILTKYKKIKITLHRYSINYHCISRIFLKRGESAWKAPFLSIASPDRKRKS